MIPTDPDQLAAAAATDPVGDVRVFRLEEPTPGPDTEFMRLLIRSRMFGEDAEPAKIGHFTVLTRLGAGGMGVVWLGYDQDLDRRVAVKLLRPEVAGDEPELAAARLRREAQAMAKLRHPNVVAVHEVGEHEGAVFIAMEYVEGTTLGGWLQEERARAWREILAHVVLAGRGLQAAHAAGIVHRDFKPDNVLVGVDGRVCVTDFGLARLGDTSRANRIDPAAELGRSLYGDAVGTPVYMARECLEGAGATAASDQFSLCVALYQALWGRHPFGLTSKVAVATVLRGGAPMRPPPSRVPARIWRLIRQGLAHDPATRHGSLEQLLDALVDDPGRRWRTRGLVGAAVLAGGIAIAIAQRDPVCVDVDEPVRALWNDTTRGEVHAAFAGTELPWAEAAGARTSEAIDGWAARWQAQAKDACEATHVHGTQSPERLDRRVTCLDRQRRSLAALLELLEDPDEAIVENAPRAASALPDPAACGDLDALDRIAERPTDPDARARLVDAEEAMARGWALYYMGKFAEARTSAEQAVVGAEASGHRPAEAAAVRLLGEVVWELGERSEGDKLLRRAVALAMAGRDDAIVAGAWLSLAYAEIYGNNDVAEAERCEALATGAVEALGVPEPFRIDLLTVRGQIALHAGRIDDGRRELERALEALEASKAASTDVAAGELSLGVALHAAGEFEAAREHLAAAVDLYTQALGTDSPYTLRARNNLANVLTALRRLDEAKREHEEVLAIRERVLGPTHPEMAASLTGLAGVHHYREEPDAALAVQQRALAIFDASLGPDHDHTLAAAENTAAMLSALGRYEEALAMAQRVVAALERTRGPDHPDIAGSLQEVARALRELGRAEESRPWIERAIAVTEKAVGADHPHMIGMLADRAETLEDLGDTAGARADLERGIALAEKLFGVDTPRLVRSLRALADLDPARAAALRARADAIEAKAD